MAKVKTHEIEKSERYKMIGDFYDIVTNLKTKDEVIGFFMGLLTPSEALMFSRRIQISSMLLEDKSYQDIREKLGVGDSTISTVNRWLFGENEQFKNQIYAHKKRKDKWDNNSNASSRHYGSLLNKYPQHRILRDLLGL